MTTKRKIISHYDGSTPNDGTSIFVFGSNLAGRHGAGAASVARQYYGAVYGKGIGRTGQAYGIPTKDGHLRPLQIEEIKSNIDEFIAYAKLHKQDSFFITRVGCGLAGFTDEEIAPLFRAPLPNCSYPREWLPILKGARDGS